MGKIGNIIVLINKREKLFLCKIFAHYDSAKKVIFFFSVCQKYNIKLKTGIRAC
jgi:hypothetical protein